MKKKISEIIIIAVVSFSALIFTTGCGMCYSCGYNMSKGCSAGCLNGINGCAQCMKCSGCIDCLSGCGAACDGE